eukprot:663469-Hanusia_phi.AAC.1
MFNLSSLSSCLTWELKICGDKWHLAKDCPEKGTAKDKKANKELQHQSADDITGNAHFELPQKMKGTQQDKAEEPQKKKAKDVKVVKF